MWAETIPETQDIPQTPDALQPSDVSEDYGDYGPHSPCKTSAADARPYPRLVDHAAITLPLQSTPIDGTLGVYLDLEHSTFHQSLETCHTAGPTHQTPNLTQAAKSLHITK